MIMVRAIIRPEKTDDVLAALMDAGFPAVTKMDVYGRGKQRGMKIGEVTYDELPKEMIFTVVKESDKDYVIKIIMQAARTGAKGPSATARFSCLRSTKCTRSVPAAERWPRKLPRRPRPLHRPETLAQAEREPRCKGTER